MTADHLETSLRETFQRTRDGVFFIVGSGRSGTTLLKSMVASHPEVAIPNETKFYTVFVRRNRRLAPLDDPQSYRRAIDGALVFWPIRDMELNEADVRALAQLGDPSWATLLTAILAAYGLQQDRPRVGEKSPGHLRHLERIGGDFPQARVVNIVRDPRAVVRSRLSAGFARRRNPRNRLAPMISSWREAAEIHRVQTERLGADRYLLVRYEDLVVDPESVLHRVCDFLGLGYTPSMLEFHSRKVAGFSPSQTEHMSNTLRPVFTSSLDRWKTELSHEQIALIEHALEGSMRQFGYEPTGAATRAARLKLTGSRALYTVERSAQRLTGRDRHPEDT